MSSQFTLYMEAVDSTRGIIVTWHIGDPTAHVTKRVSNDHLGTIPVIADIPITVLNFRAYLDAFPWDDWFGAIVRTPVPPDEHSRKV